MSDDENVSELKAYTNQADEKIVEFIEMLYEQRHNVKRLLVGFEDFDGTRITLAPDYDIDWYAYMQARIQYLLHEKMADLFQGIDDE